jgi:hypothetical protein
LRIFTPVGRPRYDGFVPDKLRLAANLPSLPWDGPKMQSIPVPDELLTTDEVIDRLLADANLRLVAATCVLPAVRYGDGWRFRRTDLEEWIRRQSGASEWDPQRSTPTQTKAS